MGCIMRNSESLKLLYKLSSEAYILAKNLNLSWSFEKRNPFDNSLYIRATILDTIEIAPYKITIVPTGLLYMQLSDPNYEIFVNPYSNLLKKESIGILPTKFDYNHKTELKVLLYNYSSEIKKLNPGDIIGYLSIIPVNRVEVEQIVLLEENHYKLRDNDWIEEDRKLENLQKQINSENSNMHNVDIKPYNQTMVDSIIEKRLK